LKHLGIAKAQHPNATRLQVLVPLNIGLEAAAFEVLAAIALHGESMFGCEEVQDVRAELVLAAELDSCQLPIA